MRLRLTRKSPFDSDVRKMISWLIRGDSRGPGGEVAGWSQNGVPSFWYAESGGYALSLFSFLFHISKDPLYRDEARRVAEWLQRIHKNGAYGRDNRLYPFDTAIILKGFLHYLMIHPEAAGDLSPLLLKMRHYLVRSFRERIPCTPLPGTRGQETRWSQRIGPHLIKAAACLHEYGRRFSDREARTAAIDMVSDVLCLWKDGWLWSPTDTALYLHPQCYALEGLMMLGEAAPEAGKGWIYNALVTLASLQDSGGGLPSHCFNRPFHLQKAFPCRADTTAQSLRAWLIDGAASWDKPIRTAKKFLLQNSHAGGAVLYEPGLEDQNVWATCFAVQALLWKSGQADPAWLL